MSILNKISTGRKGRAQKVVLYAPESFGKSTLASLFPSPLFLDVEGSTAQLDVARIDRSDLPTLSAVESALSEIVKANACQTLVIDTIDWLEEMILADVISAEGNPKIKGVEDFGYGKGFTYVKERAAVLLARLDQLIAAGITVVLLAHSKVTKHEPPDGEGAYDRYELKLTKHVAPLVKEWADALLFGNFRTVIRETDSGKMKGLGGKERVIYTSRSAAWDAKNRHAMEDSFKWEDKTKMPAQIEKAFRSVGAPWGDFQKGGGTSCEPNTATSTGNTSQASAQNVTGSSDAAQTSNPDAAAIDAELDRICAPHADAVLDYLVTNGRLKAGQSWHDLPADYANRVKKNPAGFLKQVLNGKEVAA